MAANPISKLQTIQRNMAAWAETRQTPFGVVVPKIAVPVTALGYAQVPAAYGTQAQILQYQAKADYWVMICGLVFAFQGTGTAPNFGDSAWAVDIDRPLGTLEGYPMKDYGAVPFPLPLGGAWVQPCDFRFTNGEIIRVKATPVANMGLGVGNSFAAELLGYEWPTGGFEG